MRRRPDRGTALVEAAVLFPLLVSLAVGGLACAELMLARLRAQEAARFGAWELTAYQVADLGGGDPHGRFRAAAGRVEREAARRYAISGPFLSGSGVELRVEDAPAGGVVPAAWRLSPDGRADAVARARVGSPLAPWLGPEGLALEERASVIADPWNLPDGADATLASGRASGLWLQVDRMKQPRGRLPDLRSLGLPLPDVAGPFVVSRGYRPETRSPCRGIPGYPADAMGGLEDLGDRLDVPHPRCFDTAPFRDTQEYAASLSAQQYRMRRAQEEGSP